jgi:hypothetical protein
MPDNNSLGLAAAKAKTADQVQREELVGRLMKPTAPATKVSSPATSGPTVTVACKVPMGLILRLFEWVDDTEPLFGGGHKSIKRAEPLGDTVVLRGPGHIWRTPNLQGEELEALQPAGYALTHGISKDFWDRWYEQNQKSSLVQNGLIFAAHDERDARAQSKDGRSYVSGLEPLDPANPSRSIGDFDRRLTISKLDQPPQGSRPSMIAR